MNLSEVDLVFKEDTHEYLLGSKKLISVTQLMRKHGLAPNYGDVPAEVLAAKAERGTLIHKEIEDFNNTGDIGFTKELINYVEYIKANDVNVLESEFKTHNDIVAGTVDLILHQGNEAIIADIKTTAVLHIEAVSWQLSIYKYLAEKSPALDPIKITRGQAYHFDKDGNLKVIEIPLKPVNEVERLFECERKGEIYQQPLIVSENTLTQLAEVETLIKNIEDQKKKAEEQAKELRAALLEAMEQNAIKTFENDKIRLTYVAPSTRQSVDSTKLKKENPAIYEKYLKSSEVKASLRITLKEDNKND